MPLTLGINCRGFRSPRPSSVLHFPFPRFCFFLCSLSKKRRNLKEKCVLFVGLEIWEGLTDKFIRVSRRRSGLWGFLGPAIFGQRKNGNKWRFENANVFSRICFSLPTDISSLPPLKACFIRRYVRYYLNSNFCHQPCARMIFFTPPPPATEPLLRSYHQAQHRRYGDLRKIQK